MEWGDVGLGKEPALDAREAMTVLRFGGRDEDTGREEGGSGAEGRLAWGIGELRVTAGRNIGDIGGGDFSL